MNIKKILLIKLVFVIVYLLILLIEFFANHANDSVKLLQSIDIIDIDIFYPVKIIRE